MASSPCLKITVHKHILQDDEAMQRRCDRARDLHTGNRFPGHLIFKISPTAHVERPGDGSASLAFSSKYSIEVCIQNYYQT